MKKHTYIVLTALLVMLSGCKVGPNFKSPEISTPDSYRYGSQEETSPVNDTLTNRSWWGIFGDTTLQRLISTALVANKDAAVAASRLEQARLNLRATRANMYPSLEYTLAGAYGTEMGGVKLDKPVEAYSIKPTISWEIDFFGKLRRTNESARAQLLSTESGYRATLVSLVAEVATTYFTLLAYQSSLSVAQSTYLSRQESLRLTQAEFDTGYISELNLSQARGQVAEAQAAIPQYQRAVAETENALSILLGRNPGAVPQDGTLYTQPLPAEIPVGLPSDILHRRPDVREAYYALAAQTAQIGVAQALRYPSLTLTASGGVASDKITDLLRADKWLWSASAGIVGPILNFGGYKNNVKIEREKTRQALLGYEQTVLTALAEVENALVGIQTYKAQLEAYKRLLENSRLAQKLSTARYKSGMSNYLEVLDADRALYQVEQGYVSVLQGQFDAYVSLYKAVGGGWSSAESVIVP